MTRRANRGKKGWERGGRGRRVEVRDPRPRILIVCEGLQTEPNYFRGFRLTNVRLEIEPAGVQHKTVVERAAVLMRDGYDEVWCVFDRDKKPEGGDSETFNEALSLAASEGINVAYSNDAFELWYLLHFNYIDTAISRADYLSKLDSLIPGGYKKNDPGMYAKLEEKMDDALRNAKRLHESWEGGNPEVEDPSTTVYLLVERLREFG